jgi:hypothetical protein
MDVTRTKSTTLFLTLLLLTFSTGLLAAPIDSRITAVTVYGDRAVVTRTTSSDLTAGEHALVFENLPTALLDQSIQASARGGPGATILDVRTQNIFVEATANDQVKALEDQLKSLQFELALGVDDGIHVKRRIINRFTEDTGLTNKSRRVTYEIVVSLTNNKTTTERVVFKEPTPLSRDEKIVVKLLTPREKEVGSLATPKEVTREEDGKLVWRVNLKPGEKRDFSLKLSVEHPGEIAVSGLD